MFHHNAQFKVGLHTFFKFKGKIQKSDNIHVIIYQHSALIAMFFGFTVTDHFPQLLLIFAFYHIIFLKNRICPITLTLKRKQRKHNDHFAFLFLYMKLT